MKSKFISKTIIILSITLLLPFLWNASGLSAQNIAITDDDTYTASPSAMLDVKSTTKGLLIPRLTTTQRTNIVTPATGLLVFDTSLNGFYYYNGSAWINLSSGSSSGLLWSYNAPYLYSTNTTDNIGIGTNTPVHKLGVVDNVTVTDGTDGSFIDIENNQNTNGIMSGLRFKTNGSADRFKGGIFYQRTAGYGRGDFIFANNTDATISNVTSADARLTIKNTGGIEVKATSGAAANASLFHVLNATGDTIFAVYDGGVRVNVYDDPLVKASGSKGGFAVGGFSPAKGTITNEYLRITPDSIRMYIEEGAVSKASGSKGGFAVGGFSPAKAVPSDYFNIYGATATTTINPSESRIFWYPLKEALLSGRVLVESPDSVGTNSFSTGFESKAIGNYSQAFGYHARAKGNNSTAIGNYANAISNNSFALGDSAQAIGIGSYAFGSVGRDTVSGAPTGIPTRASGNYSFAMGMGSTASGNSAFALGTNVVASGSYSMSLGTHAKAFGDYSFVFGNSTASTYYAVAIGLSNVSSGPMYGSVALGYGNTASGAASTAIGYGNTASATSSVALCERNLASGTASLASGYSTTAGGRYSSAMGFYSSTSGDGAVAMGRYTIASGAYSLAIGREIEAAGDYSVAIALSDQNGASVTTANTMAIMGGKVGIGTVAPNTTLHVNGATGDEPFRAQVNGSTKLVVLSNGGVSIGANHTTTPANGLWVSGNVGIKRDPTANDLEVNGTASKTTSGSWAANSDKRIKTDILDIENSYETILKLHPVKFQYTKEWKKRNPSIKDVFYYNFIAQEFQEIFPQSVEGSGEYLDGDSKEILQIDTYNAQIVTIKAVQDLIKENNNLKIEIERLSSMNNEKSKEIKEIKAQLEKINTTLYSTTKK